MINISPVVIDAAEFELRRSARLLATGRELRDRLNRYADPPRRQYIALMRQYLRTKDNALKVEIGGRLTTLGLPIWRLPHDKALSFLAKQESAPCR